MPFDPKFAREVLLPLAVHAYTESGIPHSCESLDKTVYKISGEIEVDPAKCKEVWTKLESQARVSKSPVEAARSSEMLATVMADSHVFGFVASKDDDTFVCFRGTHFFSDWIKDADLPLVPFEFRSGAGQVHMGFQAVYETVRQSVLDLLAKGRARSLTVLGHSLGAALATLCALDQGLVQAGGLPDHVSPIASPRVGDQTYRDTFNSTLSDCVRIVNKPDLVPRVPLPIGYRHVGTAAVIDSGATLDLAFAHGLCEGYLRGLNRTIAAPALVAAFD